MNVYLYMIKCNDGFNNPVKIGIAKDVDKRLNDLQIGCPYPLTIEDIVKVGSRRQAEYFEATCHRLLTREGKYLRGEWFKGPVDLRDLYDRVSCKINGDVGIHPTLHSLREEQKDFDLGFLFSLKYHGFI